MQHKYVGDITDFFKFFLLRKLENFTNEPLAINWYVPHEDIIQKENGNDGKKINWVSDEKYKNLDFELYSKLENIVKSQVRSLDSIKKENIFSPGTIYFDQEIPFISKDIKASRLEREKWFLNFKEKADNHNFVFLDPDNGFKEDNISKSPSTKHVLPFEIKQLHDAGKSIVLINFRDRSPAEKYGDKLYSIAKHIGKSVPIYSMRVRKHGFRDFIFIPQETTAEIFREFYRSMSKFNDFYELVGISSGKFFTLDTIKIEHTDKRDDHNKSVDIFSRRFSEKEQADFDEFYDHDFHDIEVSTYQKLLKNTIEEIKSIEAMQLNEKEQEALEYHIMKAVKLFMLRYYKL